MYSRRQIICVGGILLGSSTWRIAKAADTPSVVVIAHSLSTQREARKILQKQNWTETTSYRQADAILVVCRSGLTWPLEESYESVKELDEAADSQLNISGSNLHIYVYQIEDNLSVKQIKHVHYPFED